MASASKGRQGHLLVDQLKDKKKETLLDELFRAPKWG
jgi:hypothetical protein